MDSSLELGVPEVARILGCSIPYAQRLIRTGRVPGRKDARGWVTTKLALDKYLAERRKRNPET